MEFTIKEKKACLFILLALADCDGKRNREEINVLKRCNTVLGITLDEMLGGIAFEASYMAKSEAKSIINPMSESKKLILEECMNKIMEADGPANETEIGTWWTIQMEHELPTWISNKK